MALRRGNRAEAIRAWQSIADNDPAYGRGLNALTNECLPQETPLRTQCLHLRHTPILSSRQSSSTLPLRVVAPIICMVRFSSTRSAEPRPLFRTGHLSESGTA